MANIRENTKSGKVISYRFIACMERDVRGKQIRKYTTWTPPEGMTAAKAKKAAECAVEQGIMAHTIAAHFRADPIHTRELRAYAVDEVKRTNGQVSFENAVRSQRRIEPDDTWPGSY